MELEYENMVLLNPSAPQKVYCDKLARRVPAVAVKADRLKSKVSQM